MEPDPGVLDACFFSRRSDPDPKPGKTHRIHDPAEFEVLAKYLDLNMVHILDGQITMLLCDLFKAFVNIDNSAYKI